MFDVVIVGAGPAGSIAAITLARQGVRVLLLDRARFPRPKLCGDSLNPGAVALLNRLGLAGFPEHRAVPAAGMIVTGEGGVRIQAPYPPGVAGRFITRTHLDLWLLDQAVAAGVEYHGDTRVAGALLSGGGSVAGVRVAGSFNRHHDIPARLTIAADGRHSVLAFGLGLARHPARPRRWAVGGYFTGVAGLTSFGEMHIRAGRYIGVAPLPGGLANACLVTPDLRRLRAHRDLAAVLRSELAHDPLLGPRFADAELMERPAALGPLAVEADAAGMPGLLLAGDAAGFIDPMTGDGMNFAMRGGELAAEAALLALSGETPAPHLWLAAERKREFGFKLRFNRTLRSVVSQPRAVALAARTARLFPAPIRWIVQTAGDVVGSGLEPTPFSRLALSAKLLNKIDDGARCEESVDPRPDPNGAAPSAR